ncbi:hypothetical protein CDAR_181071 [Caerostris darwini]|uniref:Uncharacterized protein n=1 Tax=Caerostris darwini TaxID=1538125 RepID=A0AAV4U3X6_9ARAC|nr:hypothetical protein CDAR_181071 [Caerostris darwini]
MRVNIFEIKKGRVNGVVKRGMGFKGKLSALLCPGLLKIRNDEWTRRRFTKNITKTTQADKEKRLRCTKEEHVFMFFNRSLQLLGAGMSELRPAGRFYTARG